MQKNKKRVKMKTGEKIYHRFDVNDAEQKLDSANKDRESNKIINDKPEVQHLIQCHFIHLLLRVTTKLSLVKQKIKFL